MLCNRFELFVLVVLCSRCRASIRLSGPGLEPDKQVLPARYFFIDSDGDELGSPQLNVSLAGRTRTGFRCRIRNDLVRRNRSSIIVRYRLYEVCYNFAISVQINGQHVDRSPYHFSGVIYHENCNCNAEASADSFLERYACKTELHSRQIHADLANFATINITGDVIKARKRFSAESASYCHYKVFNNQLFRKCYGKHVGFSTFMDGFLMSVLRKTKLPDIDMLTNLGDWPLISKKSKQPLAMISWCGSVDTFDIVMPTYDLMESSLESLGRVQLDMLSVQAGGRVPWERKRERVFWRGRDSNPARLALVAMAKANPDLFNASITRFFFYRDQMDRYGPAVAPVSFFEFFDYKYQINIDGTVAAYRFPYLLAGDSLVFKQSSKYYEHFYRHVKAGEHYVHVKRDLSDLIEKLEWAKANDRESRQISENGMRFVRENLMPADIYCYTVQLLQEYSRKLSETVRFDPDLVLVESEKAVPVDDCNCKKTHRTEL